MRSSLQNGIVPLPLHPHLSIGKVFFLPDGDELLQTVDSFEGGIERGLAMRSAHDNEDADFADFHPSETVNHGDFA